MRRRDQRDPAFLAYIDEPTDCEVLNCNGCCRFRGWIASGRGRPGCVTALVPGKGPETFDARDPRPDVATTLQDDYPVTAAECGFDIIVNVPTAMPDDLTITLVLTDGEFVTSPVPFHVVADRPEARRADYKTVWNAVSHDEADAKVAVAGYVDEDEFRRTGAQTVQLLRDTVGIGADDVVLEIGAGVGRVGSALAPHCKRWIGTDVSGRMLRHAAERVAEHDNVEFVEINGWDLAPISSESVDVVYCTVVFMHLDEWDRFNYVREGYRVLRPGGRMHADNFNLLGDDGWSVFLDLAETLHPLDRPPNISKSSTPDELRTYFTRAGFVDVGVIAGDYWLAAYGTKPA